METKNFIKTTAMILIMAALIIFSDQIQDWIVSHYNQYVETLASRTIAESKLNGF